MAAENDRAGRLGRPQEHQIKSRDRVRDRGEVFTAEREVKVMVDLVNDMATKVDTDVGTFLEPACGDGNFLIEILRRKCAALKLARKPLARDAERYAFRLAWVLSSLYGIDIMPDNVAACRKRLRDFVLAEFDGVVRGKDNGARKELEDAVDVITGLNIVEGDALKYKTNDGHPSRFPRVAVRVERADDAQLAPGRPAASLHLVRVVPGLPRPRLEYGRLQAEEPRGVRGRVGLRGRGRVSLRRVAQREPTVHRIDRGRRVGRGAGRRRGGRVLGREISPQGEELPDAVGYAVPGDPERRVRRGPGVQLDVRRRTAGEGGLVAREAGSAEPLCDAAEDEHARLQDARPDRAGGGARGRRVRPERVLPRGEEERRDAGAVRPRGRGVEMLRNLSSPETYFQAAFRVQSPWAMKNMDGKSPNEVTILKENCYVFDFALNRALKQIADYSANLSDKNSVPAENVKNFINFMPVICYDGSRMVDVEAGEILDLAYSGMSGPAMARRWNSADLLNITPDIIGKILNDKAALAAVKKIQGFANPRSELASFVNRADKIGKLKGKAKGGDKKVKEELTDLEKEQRKERAEIEKHLRKFVTRIPIFMYLSDYREKALKDVIENLETELFTKVTGLTLGDFNLLVDVGVFNSAQMNSCIWQFRAYEEESLDYLHSREVIDDDVPLVGGWDSSVSRDDVYESMGIGKMMR